MSAVNKELSRRFTELFSTGDEALAADVLAPDIVFHAILPAAMRTWLRSTRSTRRAAPTARSSAPWW